MWAGTVCNAGLKDKQSREREISCSLQLLECPCMYSERLAKEDSCCINTKAAFGNLVIILQETSKSRDCKPMFSWCWSAFCVLVQNYMGSAFLEHCGSGSYWFLAFPQWFWTWPGCRRSVLSPRVLELASLTLWASAHHQTVAFRGWALCVLHGHVLGWKAGILRVKKLIWDCQGSRLPFLPW